MFLAENLIDYTIWANLTIWNVVKKLTDEDFNRFPGEEGVSLHERYIHLAKDTWEWYNDWQGKESESPDFFAMGRNELFGFMMGYIKKWKKLVDTSEDTSYVAERDDKSVTIGFDEIVFHLVNHHTYHRGQIAQRLRVLGKDVQMTDYVPYRLSISSNS